MESVGLREEALVELGRLPCDDVFLFTNDLVTVRVLFAFAFIV
jgi:hypothetical protein